MNLPTFPFVVLDTETTGVTPFANHIIEFAAVRCRDGSVEEEYEALIAVDDELPPLVQVLTRIRSEDIVGKPKMEELRETILRSIGDDTVIIGHNLQFDLQMLKGDGIDLTDRMQLDTSLLASLVFPELPSFSLPYLSTALELPHAPKHRALGDVHATVGLFGKIWERLLELDDAHRATAIAQAMKSTPAMRMLFENLREHTASTTTPTWLGTPGRDKLDTQESFDDEIAHQQLTLREDAIGAVPTWQHYLFAKRPTIVAVKTLHSILDRVELPEHVHIAWPAPLLMDSAASDSFMNQESFTMDEALLAMKLAWFHPKSRNELALHGEEKHIWTGRLGCTETCDDYVQQFSDTGEVVLMDHRLLFSILQHPEHPGRALLRDDVHIVIDDASMIEDTATKAFGVTVYADALRAGAAGNATMEKLADLTSLWAQQARHNEDQHFLSEHDIRERQCQLLREHIDTCLNEELTEQQRRLLLDLQKFLQNSGVKDDIVWIETMRDQALVLHRCPRTIAPLLDEQLFSRFATTLLVPPGCTQGIPAVLSSRKAEQAAVHASEDAERVPLRLQTDASAQSLLETPPSGKTIMLLSSKRSIEQQFVLHTERLEKQGVTLICQGTSGGQGRMQAEFLAAEAPTVWLLTPWMYETIELPHGSVDHLVVESLPFDHPNHPILSGRKSLFQNSFGEYAMPRLCHRLFRILRSFSRQRTAHGDMTLLDARLEQKNYGKDILRFLETLTQNSSEQQETGGGGYQQASLL